MKISVLPFLVCLGLTSLALAQPQISGPLSGNMGPGDYLVVGDCSVNGGQTLTLMPGTRFLFTGHYTLRILSNGTLHAVGTEEDSIVFTHQNPDTSCDWSGIRFLYGANAASILSYCRVEYGRYHIYPENSGGGLYIQGAAITVSRCTFANNRNDYGGAMYINVSPMTISDCVFMDNVATQNGGALYLQWNSNATVNNCVFANNASAGT